MERIIHVVYAVGDNAHTEHNYVGIDEEEAKKALRQALNKWRGERDIFHDKWIAGKKISSEEF